MQDAALEQGAIDLPRHFSHWPALLHAHSQVELALFRSFSLGEQVQMG